MDLAEPPNKNGQALSSTERLLEDGQTITWQVRIRSVSIFGDQSVSVLQKKHVAKTYRLAQNPSCPIISNKKYNCKWIQIFCVCVCMCPIALLAFQRDPNGIEGSITSLKTGDNDIILDRYPDIPINQQELGMEDVDGRWYLEGMWEMEMEDGGVGFQSQHVTSTGTFAGTRHLTESINGCVCLMLLTRCFFFGGMAVICSDTESETWWCKRTGKERFWCIKKHVASADLSIQLILETDDAQADFIQAVCSSSESKKFPECKVNLEYEIG